MSVAIHTLVAALRDRIDAVIGLPAGRAWDNAEYEPTGLPFLSDSFELADTRPAELGATARGRTEALYTVRVHVPAGTATIQAFTWASAIADALRATNPPMTVAGAAVEPREVRVEGAFVDQAWAIVPISAFLSYDHP